MTEVPAVTRPRDVPASGAPPGPIASTSERRGPGDLAAEELTQSRQLHPSRRPSLEQNRLEQSIATQRAVGRQLELLIPGGATLFHGVRVPGAGLAVDHVVVTAGGVFLLVDVTSDRRSRVDVSPDGSVTRGGVSLDRLTQLVGEAARALVAQVGSVLPLGWSVMAVPVLVVDGRSSLTRAQVAGDATVLPVALLSRWITEAFPATLDALGVAQLAGAIDLVCS